MMLGSCRRRVIEGGVHKRTKKKVWVQGFSHIMLGLADEPEHGKAFYEKETPQGKRSSHCLVGGIYLQT